ncbi:MAG: hypothetical protein JWL91_152 [Sphingomonas bacterium]|nr:hypothetical protein [Sphingomonas bacterium]
MQRYGLILVAAIGVVAAPARAEPADASAEKGQLTLSGSFRARYEAIAGQARAGVDSKDGLISLRATLLAKYQASDAIRVAVEVYDSRTYGADRGTPLTNNEANALEPVQAYIAASFGKSGGTAVDVQAGRFLLNLGSRRLVAADDYRNTTTGHTGLHAEIAGPRGTRASLIYALPQQRRPDDFDALYDNKVVLDREDLNLVLWGGILAQDKAIGPAMAELTFFHLGEDDVTGRPNRNRSLDTFGGRVIRDPSPRTIDYEVEAFYQWGSIRSSAAADAGTLDVSAWFVHAEAGYTLPGGWKPRVAIEFDQVSGDGPGGKFGRFDTLFGMRRGDFAPSGIYSTTGRANVISPAIRLEAVPSKRMDWQVTWRPLWLASRYDAFGTSGVRDASGRSGDYAGHEVQGRLRYSIVPARLRFEFDGAYLAKGRFLRTAPNISSTKNAKYASFNLTATF